MRHRTTRPPASTGRVHRWLALVSVGLMCLSATVLVSVVLTPPRGVVAHPPAEVARGDRPDRWEPPSRPAGGAVAQSRREDGAVARWRAVLGRLDRLRARAYAELDRGALRRVYTPDSAALRADAALLRRYDRHGLRVRELRMRVLALQVVRRSDRRVVLRVRERVAGGTVLGDGVRRPLAPDPTDSRRIVLHRDAQQRWRIAGVHPI